MSTGSAAPSKPPRAESPGPRKASAAPGGAAPAPAAPTAAADGGAKDAIAVAKAREKAFQGYLLFFLRGLTQFGRVAWPPLAVFIARDLHLTQVQTGELLSAFALGYLFTQVVGGMAADKLGGKPVQTLTLMALSAAMLLGPAVSRANGVGGLYWLYFLVGFFAGPSHPACNATMSEWFPQEEMGVVNSMADMWTVGGELAAAGVAPVLGSVFGWGPTFVFVGVVSSIFTLIWILFAKSRPGEQPATTASKKPGVKDGDASLTQAAGLMLYLPVWAVIVQHMCFNGCKYFFSAWMPMYFDKNFGIGPELSAGYLSIEKFVGIGTAYIFRFAEKAALRREGASLLSARRLFAGFGFALNALSVMGLAWLCRFRSHPAAPMATTVLLCLNSTGLSAHSFGFKPNYLDITARFSGALMGVGNTFATMMTYVVPLGAAYMVEAAGGDWTGLFASVATLNFVGALAGVCLTSTERLDDKLAASPKKVD